MKLSASKFNEKNVFRQFQFLRYQRVYVSIWTLPPCWCRPKMSKSCYYYKYTVTSLNVFTCMLIFLRYQILGTDTWILWNKVSNEAVHDPGGRLPNNIAGFFIKSSFLLIPLNLPFNRPKAFSTTTLVVLCLILKLLSSQVKFPWSVYGFMSHSLRA